MCISCFHSCLVFKHLQVYGEKLVTLILDNFSVECMINDKPCRKPDRLYSIGRMVKMQACGKIQRHFFIVFTRVGPEICNVV